MNKKTRTACLIAALLVWAGGRLHAQELLFGSQPIPLATDGSKSIPLAVDGKSWEIPVSSKGLNRVVQISGLGPEKNITVALVCGSGETTMHNLDWVVAKGGCLLRFKPEDGVPGKDVNLTVAAGALESGKIASPLSDDLRTKADKNPINVALTLVGGFSSPRSGRSNEDPTLWDQLRTPLLILTIIGIALCSGLLFFKFKRTKTPSADEFDPPDPLLNPTHFPAKPPVEPLRQDAAVEKTQKEHSKRLLDLESAIRDLEARIEKDADRVISTLSENAGEADRRMSNIRNDLSLRVGKIESGTAEVRDKLSEHLASQSSRLQTLFKDLPALDDLSVPSIAIPKSELARIEEQFASAVRENALPIAKLEALHDESCGLADEILEFFRTAEKMNKDQTKKRLGRVFESAKLVSNELANLSQLAATQKHGFFVELSLLEQNSLARDLAAALTRETMKLSDPEGYYLKRIAALKAQVCVAAIDLADLEIDAERRNLGLHQALAKLLQRLGMTQIDPQQNEKLQASEHQVVQFVRRVAGAQPGAIAHTLARGLQRGSEVIRKASVLLYE